jgi:hypothetical protein
MSLRDADAGLLGEHAGDLIDLGAVQGQARRLASRARPCRPPISISGRLGTVPPAYLSVPPG